MFMYINTAYQTAQLIVYICSCTYSRYFWPPLEDLYNKFRMQFVGTTTSRLGFKFSPPGDCLFRMPLSQKEKA